MPEETQKPKRKRYGGRGPLHPSGIIYVGTKFPRDTVVKLDAEAQKLRNRGIRVTRSHVIRRLIDWAVEMTQDVFTDN